MFSLLAMLVVVPPVTHSSSVVARLRPSSADNDSRRPLATPGLRSTG
jgi:hypothetical protein